MEGENTKPKILIFGGTGYLGKYMLQKIQEPPSLKSTRNFRGELDEHEKIISILKEVDVVISTIAYPQFLDQLKIVDAIKVAGNIKI
ncbi:hypothetical protein CUMW_245660 [Citrus unshiu]|uniref:NmrA-like domain-containing protein n=1 Tax=Citrus unshiu TaxID=55188 RepID=A0A2H5QN56_CITUN|nr:hypothetical protein CUMW_245660 [Citrus unshiu]